MKEGRVALYSLATEERKFHLRKYINKYYLQIFLWTYVSFTLRNSSIDFNTICKIFTKLYFFFTDFTAIEKI